MRRLSWAVLLAIGLLAAVSSPAGAAPPVQGRSAGPPAMTAAAGCLDTFHARPTTNGWAKDPCGHFANSWSFQGAPAYKMEAGVDFYWVMSGGAHITGARAWGRFTSLGPSFPSGNVREVRLGRAPPFSGVMISTTTPSAYSADSIQWTSGVVGVGCGSADGHRIGTTSYQLLSHMFGNALASPTYAESKDVLSVATYYYFATDGNC